MIWYILTNPANKTPDSKQIGDPKQAVWGRCPIWGLNNDQIGSQDFSKASNETKDKTCILFYWAK